MFASKPRGPRILYIAASARELPEYVQQWLGRAEHRAASSPHIYDALALLVGGARPLIMIVSIEAVDWSEFDFFDHAIRLSPSTRIYVVGDDHNAPKLEAARKRGAKLFDEEAIREDLALSSQWSRGPGVNELLAARLGPGGRIAARPIIRPVPPEPESEAESEPAAQEPEIGLGGSAVREEPDQPRGPDPAQMNSNATRFAPTTEAEPTPEMEVPALEALTGPEDDPKPIPFPWAPSPNRPQRIPPRTRPENGTAAPAPNWSTAVPRPDSLPEEPARSARAGQPVELTTEELAALMGRPITSHKPAREGSV